MEVDFETLWTRVVSECPPRPETIHGPDHWRRVERNGLVLAERTGADIVVVRLFALFHDSRRENEGWDDGHGERGAEYAASLRGHAYHLDDWPFELLHLACSRHSDAERHPDPTVGTCWDADRLDLGRAGIRPRPKFMSTEYGRELAARGKYGSPRQR